MEANGKLEVIDYLRGFSIFTIVLMHLVQSFPLPDIVNNVASLGGAGVHIFILCSGFGLYLSHLRKPLNYGSFLKRRFLKVYVPYIIIVFISALVPFFNTSPNKWSELLSHVFLYKMFSEELECTFGGQLWFISTIIQFYLCWPLIVRFFQQKNSLLYSIVISLLWATFIYIIGISEKRIWNSFFLQYLWEFVLGMWLARKYFMTPEKIQIPDLKILFPVCIVSLGVFGVLALSGDVFKLYNDIPSMVGYLTLSLLFYRLFPKFLTKFFIKTNAISYEWYLVHILVFGCCSHFMGNLSPWIIGTVSFGMSYIVAVIYAYLLRLNSR